MSRMKRPQVPGQPAQPEQVRHSAGSADTVLMSSVPAATQSAPAMAPDALSTQPRNSLIDLVLPAGLNALGRPVNYKIVRELGKGGQASVFLAERTDLEYDLSSTPSITHLNVNKYPAAVAVKVLEERYVATAITLFEREISAIASLHNPNIVRYISHGLFDKSRRYVMTEYVNGRSLGALVNEGQLASSHTKGILEQICTAMAAAHEKGIYHRDLNRVAR
ncbi:protein kinase [Candidatus Micrarchaeota archaeon]|nr:protein kinase [Candidatus Micrarchaeota archaeon]